MAGRLSFAMIRDARPTDDDAIRKIHVETWRDTYAGILPTRYLVDRVAAGARQQIFWQPARPGLRRHTATLVAERNSVVGYLTYGPARHLRSRSTNEIYAFYVQPDMQGIGLGRGLLDVALERQRDSGCKHVDVEVLAENPARHFYSAMGGVPIGEGTHDFAGQKLAVIFYRWTLTPG